ncbi:EAL domain-containing protein [Halomonas organivorans]|uniref:EAL domain-containing protein (Putative c-di-GMP-specific phosphodiesterase class I) n=1 Tax=Halomonas organivorans TaxID=257772 RepID=A0A7W5BUM1_9GAMM|nr:EAL domain-containing protein [Halomonas organivorans]MBB3139405.1 EAL domain-containing protein (putative c-di-GMP-specific phosphodiesterase class I) [Halomonas organivorans]
MAHCARVTGHCRRCEGALPFDFTMAFQPIVDVEHRRIHAYEALVRGPGGEPAGQVLDRVTDVELYRFDQACRVRAIEQASRLGMRESLSINFLPNAVYEPEACLAATLEVSHRVGWPPEKLIFEIVESERISDRDHLMAIITAYRRRGFRVALDDFGTGHANLDMLADLHPDKLKLDRRLIEDCHRDPRRQALIEATVTLARRLGLTLIAEGVETAAEACWLLEAGIGLQQGYYFARPALDALATVPAERFEALHAAPLSRRDAACR